MQIKDHIVICHWNSKAMNIIRELHAPVVKDKRTIVVIDKEIGEMPKDDEFDDVYAIHGDPTDDKVLLRANIVEAKSAIILADEKERNYADSKSILIALAIENLNSRVYTCVEVLDSRNIVHFRRTTVDEIISVSEISEKMLSQAAMNPGITNFFLELLTFQEEGNEMYLVDVPPAFIGKTFGDLFVRLLRERMILTAIKNRKSKGPTVNPPRKTKLGKGDVIWVIAFSKPDLKGLK